MQRDAGPASRTFAEARRTIAELERTGNCSDMVRAVLDAHLAQRELGEEDAVGDPKDVHHVVPPHHPIGFAIEESPDGYALEMLETRDARWSALRHRGALVGAVGTGILRMESYGPIHVI